MEKGSWLITVPRCPPLDGSGFGARWKGIGPLNHPTASSPPSSCHVASELGVGKGVYWKRVRQPLAGVSFGVCPLMQNFTLPALQKHFVNIFFVFAWEFCIEKWRVFFGEFFLVSVSHETKHEKSSRNREKSGAKSGAKFGTKILKIRGTFGLQLFWPNKTCAACPVFSRVAGELGAADPRICSKGPWKTC